MTASNPCADTAAALCMWKNRKDLVRLEEADDYGDTPPLMPNPPPRPNQPANNGRLSNIISKITSPFSPKPRTFSDFYITTAEDPRRRYAPGENVKGWVNLLITKPTRVTHITVSFAGFVKVYKHATPPGEGNPAEAALLRGAGSTGPYGSGSAVIFERDSVPCGDGRLAPGRYRFGFDFKLPAGPLPSSIDFERGTISYVISAILTRPVTINPTVMCEKKVELEETIDVAEEALAKPAKRAVSLRPLNKAKKIKASKSFQSESKAPPSITASQTTQNRRPSSSNADAVLPRSPSISEFSTQSGLTGSSTSGGLQAITIETGDGGSQGRNSLSAIDDGRTITAQVELLRTGYLPGDVIPLKITVKHTKRIQNMRGVIVTFYRRARVDSKPDRILTKTKSKSDYAPKSRTAFGGLTFAPPRPDHTFRMDLAQNFASLITNPNTLIAEVKTFVRIPEDIFPTITCVPDSMINFTYHLEVIMDVNGKLAALDRLMPMSLTSDPSNPTISQAAQHGYTANGHMNQFFDTTVIRRKDSIPDCVFDIVVGTKDSARKPGARRPVEPWDEATRAKKSTGTPLNRNSDSSSPNVDLPPSHPDGIPDTPPPPPIDTARPAPPLVPLNVDIPLPPPEEEVDEKTRLRRAEERLYPSAPPEDDDGDHQTGPSAPGYHDHNHNHAPSAPPLPLTNGTDYRHHLDISSAAAAGPSDISAPYYDPIAHPPPPAIDDKQELERNRLLDEVSAPDYGDGEDGQDTGTSMGVEARTPLAAPNVPSAPVLDEDAEINGDRSGLYGGEVGGSGSGARTGVGGVGHDSFADHAPVENLPSYPGA